MHTARPRLPGRALALALALFAAPALAQDHAPAGAADAHDDAGHHGAHFTGDADHDGVPNWRDADADEQVGEGTYQVLPIVFHAINLSILIGLLVWVAKPGVRDALHKRAVGIRAEIDDAQAARREAQQRHEAVSARLARLETEIGEIEARTRAEASAEEARIRDRAEEAARRIAETAQRQIADETARARAGLRAEAVELAVQLAEGLLRDNVAAADQRRLAQQFLSSIDGEA